VRLIVEDDGNQVVAVDDLAQYVEHGSFNVRLDSVSRVLAGVRMAVSALAPASAALREVDPVRQEYVAEQVLGVAQVAHDLAVAHPDDPNAAPVLQALTLLHLP
jgi:hypothetical protein